MAIVNNHTSENKIKNYKNNSCKFVSLVDKSELLLEKGYEVHGIIRRSSSFNTGRIDHLFNNPEIYGKNLFLYYGDLTDSSNLNRLLEKIEPDEIYNLGAQSHVQVSFEVPEYTAEVDGIGMSYGF